VKQAKLAFLKSAPDEEDLGEIIPRVQALDNLAGCYSSFHYK
jgi:hypothetical protein